MKGANTLQYWSTIYEVKGHNNNYMYVHKQLNRLYTRKLY